jgi:hypothetical protein
MQTRTNENVTRQYPSTHRSYIYFYEWHDLIRDIRCW